MPDRTGEAMSPAEPVVEMFPAIRKWAEFSADRVYRYELARIWDWSTPPVLFVGMNPSTADEDTDDPTIRRCVRFARDWGYGGLLMGNLFAFRATDPKALPGIDSRPCVNAIGERGPWERGCRENVNDKHLRRMAERAGLVVAAWGAIKAPYGWDGRAECVRELLMPMHALGLTKDGHPRHPLYVKASTCPIPLPTLEKR
jgi:hypothetical protein